MKARMIRKVANVKDWYEAVDEYKYVHGKEMPKSEIIIEKRIKLPRAEFDRIANNLLDDCKWVQDNKDLMRIDENGVWHVIALESKGVGYRLLINSEGFSYPRYTAIV